MNNPKRHHWWPELQSKHWTDSSGLIFGTKADGSSFQAQPKNIGVEGQLYTRYAATGDSDLTIEKWFASEIESPFRESLDYLVQLPGLLREPFRLPAEKIVEAKSLGFIVRDYRESIEIPGRHRASLGLYIAALVVRSPKYVARIQQFHEKNKTFSDDRQIKTVALDNMLHLFNVYKESIANSTLLFTVREGTNEFLFSDGGVAPEEPWKPGPIPFDILVPLTPDLAVTVLPFPAGDLSRERRFLLGRANAQGIARLNRKTLSTAVKFVFSRGTPPSNFIKKYFGVPAPNYLQVDWQNSRVVVKRNYSED